MERGKCLLIRGEFDSALQDLNRIIDHDQYNSKAYYTRGFVYKCLNDFQMAANDFETAKEIDPANHKLILNYKKINNIKYIKINDFGFEE